MRKYNLLHLALGLYEHLVIVYAKTYPLFHPKHKLDIDPGDGLPWHQTDRIRGLLYQRCRPYQTRALSLVSSTENLSARPHQGRGTIHDRLISMIWKFCHIVTIPMTVAVMPNKRVQNISSVILESSLGSVDGVAWRPPVASKLELRLVALRI